MKNTQKPTIVIHNVETLNVSLKELAPSEGITDFASEIPTATNLRKILSSERVHQALDATAKVVSLLAGASLIALLALVLLDIRQIGIVQISGLLTIVSVTFIGGIFSIGGLNLISLQAHLKKQNAVIDKLSLDEQITTNKIGLTSLTNGWHHFLFPSRNLVFVYGHECEAKLYKFDASSVECSCIWAYGENIEQNIHFAQTATHYKEELLAIGDYSSGAVIICDLRSMKFYAISPSKSFVSSLAFSHDGKHLLITYGHAPKNGSVYLYNIDNKQVSSLEGASPVTWINNSKLVFVKDEKALCLYDIESESERVIHNSYNPIRYIACNGDVLVFAEHREENKLEKQLLDIQLGRLNAFYPQTITRTECNLEQLAIADGMLFVATSWNGSNSDTRRLRVYSLGGEIISEFAYDSGHGHGYPKYSYITLGERAFVSTTGVNGYVPIVELNKKHRTTIRQGNDADSPTKETWISVQLNRKGDGHIYLSVLSHNGQFGLYDFI